MSKNRQSVVASVSDAGKGKSKKKQPAGAGLSFYDLAANVPGVVYQFQIEPDGKRSLPYVSPTVYDYLGLRPEEVMADVEKWFAITHPDDLPALESSIKESLHNMAQWHWQGRFLKNGTDTVWFRGSSNPRKLEDGSVLWNGVFVDVTQQRQAEDSLRRSHEKLEDLISKRTEQLLEKTRQYQILIENAADGIFIHDEEGRIVECNKHIMDSMGYSEQEIKGLTIFDINPNLDKEKVIMALRSDIAGEERLFETHHKCKDGTIFPVEIKRAGYERDGNRYFVAVVRDVSKRHEIEQKLADQEEKYRSLFELSDDANMTLDRESFLDCNQATLDMFGYATKEEFLGKHPSEISPPCQPDGTDSRAAADKHIADAYSKQKDFFEWMHRRANGENFPAEVLLKPMKLEGREVLQAIVRDITERKRAELALVESEARFREMADQAPALIWMADTENKGVWYNRRWLDYTGRAMGQELGFGWIDGMHHDDRERCASFCQSAFDQKEQFDMEFRLRRADGSYGWIADTGIPRFDRDGKFIGYIGYCWDITDRKRAQFALSDSEARFRTLSMHAPVGIYLTDVEGKCVYVNDKWQEMTGLSEQQAFGEGWAGALHPEDREAVFLEWKRFAKESDEFSMEYRFSKPDGEVTWVSGKAIALRDTEDNFIGYLGSITDITERKAVEEKLVAAKREADAANNAKSEFLSRMSHELRTPLNAILGFGQLLQIDARILNEEQRVAITHIMEGGKHLLHLINEVLDIAAVDAGEIKLSCEPVLIKDALDSALLLVQSLASKHNVAIENLSKSFPFIVRADEQRLKQILINLISNAVKYNRSGGEVSIECTRIGSVMARISIKDTGVGIKSQDKTKIFEPFQRLSLSGEYIEGTGIGLTITRKLVELMDGRIGFDSKYGMGSTFWFELPLAQEKPQVVVTDKAKGATRSVRSYGKTILYIEDNPANLRLIEQLLTRHTDCILLSATNAQSGIEMARQSQPDLILMDIGLPGMDGYEALELLQQDEKTAHIPVVAVTAQAMSKDVEKARNYAFKQYITKPIDVAEVLQIIKDLF